MARVLVVDDEGLMRTMVQVVCNRMGHETLLAGSIQEALRMVVEPVDVVLLDVWLPDGNGLEYQAEFAHLPGSPDVVVITGNGDGDNAEAALRSGAWEYLTKPLQMRDIEQCLKQVLQFRQNRTPACDELVVDSGHILGSGQGMNRALKLLAQAAKSEVNVLLLGETGVGKELFARALFRNSARAAKPFITVDCASLPETLVESHLFGHSRGAFTGADRARDGLLLAADKGTLFLDEVGDLPQPMQGVFLRALEQRRFRPVGEVREVSSDFRLVAATNKNLKLMAKENSFRSDLLYRLQGITIVIPPLRERLDEIPALARQAIARFCLSSDQAEKHLSDDALGMLLEYAWPGNVRELIHCIQRACLTAGKGELLLPVHLPTHMRVDCVRRRMGQAADLSGSARKFAATAAAAPCIAASCGFSAQEMAAQEMAAQEMAKLDMAKLDMAGQAVGGQNPPSLREWKLQAEKAYVRQVWDLSGEDVRKAAEVAGISRGHWYELMKKIGL